MSLVKLSIRAGPHSDFVTGYPGVPAYTPPDGPHPSDPLTSISHIPRLAAHISGQVLVSPADKALKSIKAKWLKVELEKVEALPPLGNGKKGETLKCVELIGAGPSLVWSAGGKKASDDQDDQWDTIPSGSYPFKIPIPEALPPSIEIDTKGCGISYRVTATMLLKGKKGILKTATKIFETSDSAPVSIIKSDLLPTWPSLSPVLQPPYPPDLPWSKPNSQFVLGEVKMARVKVANGLGGEVWMKCFRESGIFGPGDPVKIRVLMGWEGDRPIVVKRLDYVLRESFTYFYPPQQFKTSGKTQSKTHALINLNTSEVPDWSATLVRNGDPLSYDFSGDIPTTHTRMSVGTGKQVLVNYYIKVRAILEGGDEIFVDHWNLIIGGFGRREGKGMMDRIGWDPVLCTRPGLPAQITSGDPRRLSAHMITPSQTPIPLTNPPTRKSSLKLLDGPGERDIAKTVVQRAKSASPPPTADFGPTAFPSAEEEKRRLYETAKHGAAMTQSALKIQNGAPERTDTPPRDIPKTTTPVRQSTTSAARPRAPSKITTPLSAPAGYSQGIVGSPYSQNTINSGYSYQSQPQGYSSNGYSQSGYQQPPAPYSSSPPPAAYSSSPPQNGYGSIGYQSSNGYHSPPPNGYGSPPPGGYQNSRSPPPNGYQQPRSPPPGGYQNSRSPPPNGYQQPRSPPPGSYYQQQQPSSHSKRPSVNTSNFRPYAEDEAPPPLSPDPNYVPLTAEQEKIMLFRKATETREALQGQLVTREDMGSSSYDVTSSSFNNTSSLNEVPAMSKANAAHVEASRPTSLGLSLGASPPYNPDQYSTIGSPSHTQVPTMLDSAEEEKRRLFAEAKAKALQRQQEARAELERQNALIKDMEDAENEARRLEQEAAGARKRAEERAKEERARVEQAERRRQEEYERERQWQVQEAERRAQAQREREEKARLEARQLQEKEEKLRQEEERVREMQLRRQKEAEREQYEKTERFRMEMERERQRQEYNGYEAAGDEFSFISAVDPSQVPMTLPLQLTQKNGGPIQAASSHAQSQSSQPQRDFYGYNSPSHGTQMQYPQPYAPNSPQRGTQGLQQPGYVPSVNNASTDFYASQLAGNASRDAAAKAAYLNSIRLAAGSAMKNPTKHQIPPQSMSQPVSSHPKQSYPHPSQFDQRDPRDPRDGWHQPAQSNPMQNNRYTFDPVGYYGGSDSGYDHTSPSSSSHSVRAEPYTNNYDYDGPRSAPLLGSQSSSQWNQPQPSQHTGKYEGYRDRTASVASSRSFVTAPAHQSHASHSIQEEEALPPVYTGASLAQPSAQEEKTSLQAYFNAKAAVEERLNGPQAETGRSTPQQNRPSSPPYSSATLNQPPASQFETYQSFPRVASPAMDPLIEGLHQTRARTSSPGMGYRPSDIQSVSDYRDGGSDETHRAETPKPHLHNGAGGAGSSGAGQSEGIGSSAEYEERGKGKRPVQSMYSTASISTSPTMHLLGMNYGGSDPNEDQYTEVNESNFEDLSDKLVENWKSQQLGLAGLGDGRLSISESAFTREFGP